MTSFESFSGVSPQFARERKQTMSNDKSTEHMGENSSSEGGIVKENTLKLLSICPFPMVLTSVEKGGIIEVNSPFTKFANLENTDFENNIDSLASLGLVRGEDQEEIFRAVHEQGRLESLNVVFTPRDRDPVKATCSAAVIEWLETKVLVWFIVPKILKGAVRQVDEELLQSQRLESVGRLAGAIAHDFGNLISPIIGYAEMGLAETDPSDSRHSDFSNIRDAALEANALTKQLLAFGRQQKLSIEVLDFNRVLSKSESLLRRLIREDINIEIRQDPNLGKVKGDTAQLQQVLINLVLNARDSMPRGGTMVIETANTIINAEQIRGEVGVEPGRFIMLSVSDTGYGMDEGTQSRVFEPFFTTKSVSQGLGMGLATAYGIAKQHGGTIWVFSKPGKGSIFKFCLPKFEKRPSEHPTPSPAPGTGPSGTETILVVEDEDIVRRMVCRILKTHGYNVLRASGGFEAIELALSYNEKIDLLLTDVIMPKMNGKELRDKIVEMRPQTKIMYMSGYADVVIARHGVLDDEAGFLQKPFSLWDLTTKVRETLDQV